MVLQNKEVLNMRVTTKGQVTIPRNVREILGIVPETEVEFQEDNGRFYIVKESKGKPTTKFTKLRGIATAKMSTDEIMNLTREKQ
jgi:AbrB family looped-hinge helix DNA binding protein